MKNTVLCGAVSIFLSIAAATPTADACKPPSVDDDLTLQDVPLRPGVTSDIHVHLYNNPHVQCRRRNARTVLTVHGAAATGATWGPMADALFASSSGGAPICRVAAMDLPGHGGSSLPQGQGVLFGDLSLEDYVSALYGTIDRLDDAGIRVTGLGGHSMGAMVIQLAQQDLADQGTSLRHEFGITHALFLGPVPPKQIPSAYVQDPTVGQLLGAFICFDPMHGLHFSIPDALWPELTFTDIYGNLISTAPSGEDVAAQGYNALESVTALSELVGVPPYERPDIDAGIFADSHGTKLTIIVFENDSVVRVEEGRATYQYLTGKSKHQRFSIVPSASAVHGAPISEPDQVVDAIQSVGSIL